MKCVKKKYGLDLLATVDGCLLTNEFYEEKIWQHEEGIIVLAEELRKGFAETLLLN